LPKKSAIVDCFDDILV